MDSFRKSRNNRRGRNIEKRNYITDQSRYEGKCFESGNYGHIDNECPEAKKNYARWSKNKKALGDKSDDDNIENEHEEIGNIWFIAVGESSTEVCNNCNYLKNLLGHDLTYLNRYFSDFRNLQHEKRNFEIKLEVSEVEKYFLYKKLTN